LPCYQISGIKKKKKRRNVLLDYLTILVCTEAVRTDADDSPEIVGKMEEF